MNATRAHHGSRAANDTLVALIGQLRGGEHAARSLIRFVLKPNRADLVLMVADSPALHASPLRAHAKHVWVVPEPADWSQPMEEIASRLGARGWRGLANRSGTVEFLGPARVRRGGPRSPSSSGILLTYRHLLMEKLVDLGYTHKYSRFVISRADHVYGCEHALGGFELSKHVYIPRGEDYGGVCDRHIVCGASTVVRCLSMLQGALLHPERYSGPEQVDHLGPEVFFALRLRELGLSVRRFARVMFVARLEGETSSAHGVFRRRAHRLPLPAAPNQQTPYIDEIVATRWTCGYCNASVLGGAWQPFCCAGRLSAAMALEDSLGLGRIALVNEVTGACSAARALVVGARAVGATIAAAAAVAVAARG